MRHTSVSRSRERGENPEKNIKTEKIPVCVETRLRGVGILTEGPLASDGRCALTTGISTRLRIPCLPKGRGRSFKTARSRRRRRKTSPPQEEEQGVSQA